MDTNDFLGSFAQENVLFSTKIVRTAAVGDNFYKAMIFVENSRFVDASGGMWVNIPGSTTCKALTVTADDYADYTSGLLQSWLYDLFCSGFTGDCILVACGDVSITYTYTPVTLEDGADITGLGYYHRAAGSSDDWELATETTADTSTYEYATRSAGTVDASTFITNMEEAYGIMKPYAYHKTVCAGGDDAVLPTIAVDLAQLCGADKGLLSGAPLLPFTTATPASPLSDPLYSALSNAGYDAFMSAHQDTTRNGSLVSLGIALSSLNGSGTSVGNNMEMTATSMFTSSGPSGTQLAKSIRDALANLNIQTWKPVGDNSGSVAAFGATTLNGDTYSATWILAYITYIVKVRVAQMLTEGNFLKNAANYSRIIGTMNAIVGIFVDSGRLENYVCSAPAYKDLPEAADDEIIVPDAWSATYVSNVRKVTITGTLYIGA